MDLSTLLSIMGVILAVLSLFVPPGWITSAINKTILSNRQKRIDFLKRDYYAIKLYSENQTEWTAALIASISSALAQLTLFVFWIGANIVTLIRKPELDMITSFNGFITFYFLFVTLSRFNSTTKLFNDVVKLDRFKQETIKKLIKLDLSTEEATAFLDKEET